MSPRLVQCAVISLTTPPTSRQTLLAEKNPSPLAPFSSVIPILITDPRYVLLPSQTDREATFNEWCKEAARLARLAKASVPIAPVADSSSSTSESTADPKIAARAAYDALLSTEVASTRTAWDEFKRKWKKGQAVLRIWPGRSRKGKGIQGLVERFRGT